MVLRHGLRQMLLANSLVAMANYDMFNSDDTYELKDSLLERYCFFIDIVSQ